MRKNGWWNHLTMRARAFALAGGMVVCVLIVGIGESCNSVGMMITGCAVFVCLIVAHILLIRCPHCGHLLGRDLGEYCPHCGEKLDPSDD